MITLAQIPEDVRIRIARICFDRMVEKHEGPMSWKSWLEDAEVFEIDDRPVLFLIPKERRDRIPRMIHHREFGRVPAVGEDASMTARRIPA